MCKPIHTLLSRFVYEPYFDEKITSEAHVKINKNNNHVWNILHSSGSQIGSSSNNKPSKIKIINKFFKYQKPSNLKIKIFLYTIIK